MSRYAPATVRHQVLSGSSLKVNPSIKEEKKMACSAETVKLDLDHPTEAMASSQAPLSPLMPSPPPPPYLPSPPHLLPTPPHPQSAPPAFSSAPPPEYSQVMSSKTYESSNATGPYLYTTSQTNHPQQQMLLPPYSQTTGGTPSQQVVLMEVSSSNERSGRGHPSFVGHFILSCCVFWCCGWMCGGIAFIVALIAQSSASSGDLTGARRLGHVSLVLSICGIVVGTILTIVVFAEAFKNGS